MRLTLKSDQKNLGYTENFKFKHSAKGLGFTAIVSLTVLEDSLAISEPYFYFNESFIKVADACKNLGDNALSRYMSARKPTHSLLTRGSFPAKVTAMRSYQGTETWTSITLLTPLKPTLTKTEVAVRPMEPKNDVALAWDKLGSSMALRVNSREDFIAYRLAGNGGLVS